MHLNRYVTGVLFLLVSGFCGRAQDSSTIFNLDQCLQYAYDHNPSLLQVSMDRKIADYGVKSKLGQWYPQIDFSGNYQHNFQLTKNNIGGNIISFGVNNTSSGLFSATQNLFSPDALLASSTAGMVRLNAEQNYTAGKISVNLNVAKAFYDVLLYQEQIKVLDENITYLVSSLKTAKDQYNAGIVDKIDYKRAQISLNSTQAQKRAQEEQLKARYSNLKMLMGYPDAAPLALAYDSTQLESMAIIDTTMQVDYTQRIEYKNLLTQKSLQEANYKYNKWQFLPTVQAFAAYNLSYLNNNFGDLYKDNLPNSYAGIKLTVPIFSGFTRKYNIEQAKLNIDRASLDLVNVKNSIENEYQQALAAYKGYFVNFRAARENVDLSKEVYNTIMLQYKAGVKTYLELIVAQTDLRTSELNYTNALYQLLESKYDVDKALGLLNP